MMSNSRLTFYDPTNLTLPILIYDTLVKDALHFGYIKNEQANISGLLNRLLPCLTDYRDDLHKNLLISNDNNEILTTKIEENIYKVYFNKYDYCDDGVIVVPFRVNKEHLQDFLDIYDNKLAKYNMDFTNFVRSLLIEYSSKRLNQREYFFFYRIINNLKNAIEKNLLCYFYTEQERFCFVPVSMEVSKKSEQNFIVGINVSENKAYILPLSYIKRIIFTDINTSITNEHCNLIYDTLENYYKNMEN